MALLHLDNFENWEVFPGTFTSTQETALAAAIVNNQYWGGNTATSGNGAYARLSFNTVPAELIVNVNASFDLPTTGPTDKPEAISFWNAGNRIATLSFDLAGFFELRATVNGTLFGTSTFPIVTGVKYDVELRITFGAAGTADLYINGSLSDGFSVPAVTSGSPNNMTIGTFEGNEQGVVKYEHLIVMDGTGAEMNAPIGPVEVNSHTVTANGNYIDWTPNGAATLAECVDDPLPNGDTDYASSSTVGQKMSFVCSDLPPGVTTVFAVGVWQNASRDDALARGFKSLLWNGAGDQLSADENFVSTGYGYYLNEFPVNPFTGIAWTPAEVDAMQYGAELTT